MKYITRSQIAKKYNLTSRKCHEKFRSAWKDHPPPVKRVQNEAFYDKELSDIFFNNWHRKQEAMNEYIFFQKNKNKPFAFSGDSLLILQFLQPGIRYRSQI